MHDLTREQVDTLRGSLRDLRGQLERLLDATREGARPVDLDEPIGRLTRIDAIQQQGLTAVQRRGHDLRLRQVLQALERIDRGEYGGCRRCEEPVGFPRLEARPESPYCLDCQDHIDRKHG